MKGGGSVETCKVTIQLKEGLQAKAAVHFVQRASAFKSKIKLCLNEKKIEAKSIMGVMATATSHGTEVFITFRRVTNQETMDDCKQSIGWILW